VDVLAEIAKKFSHKGVAKSPREEPAAKPDSTEHDEDLFAEFSDFALDGEPRLCVRVRVCIHV
jgi:hypothetical protein